MEITMAKWILLFALAVAVLWGGCDRYEPAPLGPYPTAPTDPVPVWSKDLYYDANQYHVDIYDGGVVEIELLGGPTFERLSFAAFVGWADSTIIDGDPPVIDPGPNPDDPGDIEADPDAEPLDPTFDPPSTDVPDEPSLG
jgi:hypothetical protein